MAVLCIVLGSMIGLAGTAVSWAMGADLVLALIVSFSLGYFLSAVLLALMVRLARDPNDDLEYELLALHEAQLRAALKRAGRPEADHPVLFRALRLQERTALRARPDRSPPFPSPSQNGGHWGKGMVPQ